jgi:hypothetical protein
MPDTITVWEFEGGGAACDACQEKNGFYDEEPSRPHEDCACEIKSFDIEAELISEEREVEDQFETYEQKGWISEGGSFTREISWSTGTSWTGTAQIGGEGGGASVSVGAEAGGSQSSGEAESYTWNWDDSLGGDKQMALIVYQLIVWRITRTYEWSTAGGGGSFEFEVIDHEEEEVFKNYRNEPVGD